MPKSYIVLSNMKKIKILENRDWYLWYTMYKYFSLRHMSLISVSFLTTESKIFKECVFLKRYRMSFYLSLFRYKLPTKSTRDSM